MSEFAPVETASDLATLDDAEIVAGYIDGLRDESEPGSDKSRAYWHGWRNAQTDRGRTNPDVHQQRLVRDILGHRVSAH